MFGAWVLGGRVRLFGHALVTARVAGWRAVVGCVRWIAWKLMKAFKTPGRWYARLWWDRGRALVVGDTYLGRWARCDCNLGGRVISSGFAAWITSRWVVVSMICMGRPCGPGTGAVADPLIMATDFVGWTMTLLRDR